MELKLKNGDYVPDGCGGLCRLDGTEEVLARALYRLTARRGGMPFLPEVGSRLYRVLREKPSVRPALAAQYVAEALEAETSLKVTGVEWLETASGAEVTVRMEWNGENLNAVVQL